MDKIDFPCDAAKAALLSQYGLSYGRNMTPDPDAAKLKVVVRSGRTGAVGSVTVPLAR